MATLCVFTLLTLKKKITLLVTHFASTLTGVFKLGCRTASITTLSVLGRGTNLGLVYSSIKWFYFTL
jgi:hypothetical protein